VFSISAQIDGFALMVASGTAGPDELCAAASFLAELVHRSGERRLLVDLLALNHGVGADDHAAMRDHLDAVMPPLDRLAIAIPEGSSLGLLVGVARAKGVDAREFASLGDAEAWLAEP
jgi:hypothetical protein